VVLRLHPRRNARTVHLGCGNVSRMILLEECAALHEDQALGVRSSRMKSGRMPSHTTSSTCSPNGFARFCAAHGATHATTGKKKCFPTTSAAVQKRLVNRLTALLIRHRSLGGHLSPGSWFDRVEG
jgi:hypothetical protein